MYIYIYIYIHIERERDRERERDMRQRGGRRGGLSAWDPAPARGGALWCLEPRLSSIVYASRFVRVILAQGPC